MRAPCKADPSDANGRRVDPSHANGMLHLQNAHRTKIFGTIRTTHKDLIRTSVHQQKWNMEDADSNSVAKCFDQRSLVGIVARKDLCQSLPYICQKLPSACFNPQSVRSTFCRIVRNQPGALTGPNAVHKHLLFTLVERASDGCVLNGGDCSPRKNCFTSTLKSVRQDSVQPISQSLGHISFKCRDGSLGNLRSFKAQKGVKALLLGLAAAWRLYVPRQQGTSAGSIVALQRVWCVRQIVVLNFGHCSPRKNCFMSTCPTGFSSTHKPKCWPHLICSLGNLRSFKNRVRAGRIFFLTLCTKKLSL